MFEKSVIKNSIRKLILYRACNLDLNLSATPISRLNKTDKKIVADNSLKPRNKLVNKNTNDKDNIVSRKTKPDLIYAKNNYTKSAQKLALSANNIEELSANLDKFNGCEEIRHYASNRVFFDGNPRAKLLIIGEAPGSQEDQLGQPFVGQSGQLLDLMLSSINIKSRQDYLISNTVFWRPPGNRTPTKLEIQSCFPFVLRLIQLSSAKVILTLGKSASKQILCSSLSMPKLNITKHDLGDFPMRTTRGKVFKSVLTHCLNTHIKDTAEKQTQNRHYNIMPSFHPSYLLRDSRQKAKAYIDMLKLRQLLLDKNHLEQDSTTSKIEL